MTIEQAVSSAISDLISLLEASSEMVEEGAMTPEQASQVLALVKPATRRLAGLLDRIDGIKVMR